MTRWPPISPISLMWTNHSPSSGHRRDHSQPTTVAANGKVPLLHSRHSGCLAGFPFLRSLCIRAHSVRVSFTPRPEGSRMYVLGNPAESACRRTSRLARRILLIFSVLHFWLCLRWGRMASGSLGVIRGTGSVLSGFHGGEK